jgi:hypothetical protein
MACEVISTEGAVFALWGKPQAEDMDVVKNAMLAASAASGKPVVYVTRVPVDAPPPDAAARARLDEVMPSLVKVCSTYHVVLEGEGFGAAMKRGVLTGIFQLSWRRGTFFVHATADEVERSVAPELRHTVQRLLEAARRQGLLTSSFSTSGRPPQSSVQRR